MPHAPEIVSGKCPRCGKHSPLLEGVCPACRKRATQTLSPVAPHASCIRCGAPTTGQPGYCPACRDENLVTVTYVYGDQLGPYSGRVRSTEDLAAMAHEFGAFSVYVVEVCQRCHWNFLLRTYVLGDGVPRRPPATPRDLID